MNNTAEHPDSNCAWDKVAIVLLIAFVLRMIYASALPLNIDEVRHLEIAGKISLEPGTFHFPLGNKVTNHPMLSIYVTTIAKLVGGTIFFTRFIFIFLGIISLLGLFNLAKSFFGYPVAFIALSIAALDIHLIAKATLMLEPAYLCTVPWIILLMYNCLTSNQTKQWLALGALLGIGYLFYEITVLLIVPFFISILIYRRLGVVLRNRHAYLGALLFIVLVSPSVTWNLTHQMPNFAYTGSILSTLGLTPRLLILYIGGLLVSFLDSTHVQMSMANTIYMPTHITCNWIMGLLYLCCVVYSIRYWKSDKHMFLILVFGGIGLPVSLVHPKEPWNCHWWGNMTIIPAVILTAYAANLFAAHKNGRIILLGGLLFLCFSTLNFLTGPKYGYFSPSWEKNLMADFLYYSHKPEKVSKARQLVGEAVKKHPGSVIANYYRMRLSRNFSELAENMQRVLEISPYNPLVTLVQVDTLIRNKEWADAKRLLCATLSQGYDYHQVHEKLAYVEFKLGNYQQAESEALAALNIKPDAYNNYELLFFIYDAVHEAEKSRYALETYMRKTPMLAERHFQCYLGISKKSWKYYHKALELEPRLPMEPPWLKTGQNQNNKSENRPVSQKDYN